MKDTRLAFDRLLDEMWPDMSSAFLDSIADMRSVIAIGRLERAVEAGDLAAAFEALRIEREFFAPLDESFREVFSGGANYMASTVPANVTRPDGGRIIVRFDGRNPRAEAWIRDHSSELIQQITEDQRSMVQESIRSGLERGDNPRKTALDIAGRRDGRTGRRQGGMVGLHSGQAESVDRARQQLRELDSRYFRRQLRDSRFDGTVRKAIREGAPLTEKQIERITGHYADRLLLHRAQDIAQTETIAALNAGRLEQVQQLVDKGEIGEDRVTKTWNDTGDGRTRTNHRLADGQKVGMNGAFRVGGYMLRYPGDTSLGAPASETVRCRCYMETDIDWIGALGDNP